MEKVWNIIVIISTFTLAAIVRVLCFALETTFTVAGIALVVASVIVGGIGKVVGSIGFFASLLITVLGGFSWTWIAVMAGCIVLATSRQWLKGLSDLCMNLSSVI